MLEIGAAKVDITAYEVGQVMFGWGHPSNTVEGVAEPLHARSFVIKDPRSGTKLALCVADLGYITQAVRQGVMDELGSAGWDEANVMLTATHTHSGPGGLSQYLFYCIGTAGYSELVLRRVVSGIVESIVKAEGSCEPGRLSRARGAFPLDTPVAFNRSIASYNSNPEVSTKVRGAFPPEAVDREMNLLCFQDAKGRPLGSLSFFGVHNTNVHRDNRLIHSDNKGIAAEQLETQAERAWDAPGFVAAFAQAPCGDVTPNFRFQRDRGLNIGPVDDDFESARLNGGFQSELARALYENSAGRSPLEPRLDAALMHADLANVEVASRFADGLPGQRTCPAAIGFRMLFGTKEGPGLPLALTPPLHGLAYLKRSWQRFRSGLGGGRELPSLDRSLPQGNKLPFLDTGNGAQARLFGLLDVNRKIPFGAQLHPFTAYVSRALAEGGFDENPWTPNILPLQLFIIGDLAIAAVPGEPTTMTGRRLAATLRARLAARGVSEVIIIGYANAYAGYVTTPTEYDRQVYEGASTHFGRWTLGAYQTLFDRLARRLLLPAALRPEDPGPTPLRFDADVLAARARVNAPAV